jgi:CDP-diacylglycerol--serine O-phosphatidyltransferase
MIKKSIPNAITCGNLLCGCLAITSAFHGDLVWAAYLVGIAAVLDFLDGFAARILKVHSEIGKQLDSLADMVTFGVVPGIIMFHLITISVGMHFSTVIIPGLHTPLKEYPSVLAYLPFISFLIPVFSALRLAKFNIDTRQSDSFIGVPTPANSILIASFPLILGLGPGWEILPPLSGLADGHTIEPTLAHVIILNPWFLIGITVIMSFLLVAELPLFALKFKHFKWKGNEIRFIFLLISLAMLILFKFLAIPFIIFLYIVLSVINNIGKKKKEQDYDLIAKQ